MAKAVAAPSVVVVAAAAVAVVFTLGFARLLKRGTHRSGYCPNCAQWPEAQDLATVIVIISAVCQVKPSTLQSMNKVTFQKNVIQ